MTKTYLKHLVECTCILPQFQNRKQLIYHKFPVFSIIDEQDKVEEKIVICPNCRICHKVYEIGKSELLKGENLSSLRNIKDIKAGIPQNILNVIESYDCDITTYEEIEFILENELWNKEILLSKEKIENEIIGKILIIKNYNLVKVETF